MGGHIDPFQSRLLKRDADGKPLPLITGQESLEELRNLILQFSQACPAKQAHARCPFILLGGLSHDSRTQLVNSLPREACLDLFQMELDCRTQATSPCSSPNQVNPP